SFSGCNCNNHATSCHFDPAVYEQTGRISGGVCDGCRHNTMGPNCEQCKPFYYRDPLRDIQDPEVCRPCDCDPVGSTDAGACDSTTDPINGLEAGKCHCKTNVEGRRCDYCKNGFWNFTSDNPDGCQPCTCDILGTIGNQGCNAYSGECTCKRYVKGRNCDQCLPEYWGLSDKRDGCQACDCDPGGSYDNNCDVITGQCKCREHMTGRQCDIAQQQHFTASLDFLLYEAELAQGSATCQVVIREPYRDGRPPSWTGTGFMKAPEGSYIEFQITNIKTSMDYDIAIRYEPTLPENWNDVTLTVIRPDPIDPQGPCASTHPSDDTKRVSLPSNSRSAIAFPPTCLEAGKSYIVRIDFNNYKYGTSTPSASILVDSIVLVPRIEKIPWFQGSVPAEARRREYEEHRCDIALENPNIPLSEVCKQHHKSIGAYIFNGAFSCQCDPTGSTSKLCNDHGGACSCKLNVVGRRCDRCAPGTYGFGPEGCKACDCNSIGALNNFCNVTTGQCKCRSNTYGRECDQCRTGFWNFPNCERCDCNGHADICDSRTGVCIDCKDHTEGHHCDYCKEGFYGDPRIGFDIPCRPCPCPGFKEAFHSFADRCILDSQTKDVVCECKEGYAGSKCDVCADNYYGNPEIPGGSCQLCDCSNKIDPLVPGNCDPHTGKCLRCLYDTTGDHCEICRDGFFRLSIDDNCQPCTCQFLGTNETAGPCDRETGQCKCLPNVIGKDCDKCEKNHWKIASGKGCEPCDCDPLGSMNPQCNEYEGQCLCKENFGGRQCNECRENYWGNPREDKCIECLCNPEGSKTPQCDRKTGNCVCREGIGGRSCDECARGYLGTAPYCSPCGECFDNWDRILKEHENKTLHIIERGKNIKKIGATGAYTKEFDEMQNQLDEIEQLLNSTTNIDIDQIEDKINNLANQIQDAKGESPDELLNNVTKDIKLSEIKLNELRKDMEKLVAQTQELRNNGTTLQEADVQGALNLVRMAKDKAATAAHKAEHTQSIVDYAERQCKAAENLVNVTEAEFKRMQQENEQALDRIKENITNLNNMIPELNKLVCDGTSNSPDDSCDSICGGAGCGSCGESVSCQDGAKQQALFALSYANDTEKTLKEKEEAAEKFFRNISQLNTTQAKNSAQETLDKANKLYSNFNNSLQAVNNIKKQIDDFINQNNSTPDEIRQLAEKVLKKDINLTKEEIQTLQKKIQEALETLTNPDKIILETRDDLQRVHKLKEDADNAKAKSSDILKTAEGIKEALLNSSVAQNDADEAITDANKNIDTVHELLTKIGAIAEEAHNKTQETSGNIKDLSRNLTDLQNNMRNNERFAQRVIEEAAKVHQEANHTNKTANELLNRYDNIKYMLSNTSRVIEDSKVKANELSERAYNITHKIESTESEIKQLISSSSDQLLKNLENEIDQLINRMHAYSAVIEERHNHYKSCT
ncbi:laminin subunit beta-1-like, partial [Agrilus planipennis]|uniref:Laminin subunit beta-1-like n=1 Tax=Agrilus planipennis TaxID=224129 RepID=A0A7F5RFF2_AGRPL